MKTIFTAFVHAQAVGQSAWNYSYHPNGLLASADGPRTDVADITHYSYDGTGRLTQITNALGHTTTLSNFDSHGKPQTITDANGVTTTLNYTPQGWLHSSSTAGSTTSYQYDAIGQITQVTLGDGSWLHYTWDAARRLTAIENAQGERVEYSLDAQGNRTSETLRSSNGSIRFQQQRIYDELSRLRQSIGAGGQSQHHSYDVEGKLISSTNAAGNTTHHNYDALNRLTSTQDALGGMSNTNYDAQNRPTHISDPRSVTTTYEYDALGNLSAQHSPDSGTTIYQHDSAGNIIQSTDARGIATHYTWDALNRITSRSYPTAPELNVTYGYDSGSHGIGRLTSMQDASGTSTYTWDAHGRLASRSHSSVIANTSPTTTVSWAYNLAGRITNITYPNGVQVHYGRDSVGRISTIHLQTNGAAAPQAIASNITYAPWGAVQSLTWGNGLNLTRTYNQDARLIQQSIATLTSSHYTRDANGNITQIQSSEWGSLDYHYDALERLLQSLHSTQSSHYSYDPVGNRVQKNDNNGTTHYSYAGNSNRLTAINGQSVHSDPTGNITQDTQNRSFTYDAQGRLQSTKINATEVAHYSYNALGQRSHKHTINGTTLYHYDQEGPLLGWTHYNANGIAQQSQYYIWLEQTPIAALNIQHSPAPETSEILYLHPDHLDTPRLASNQQQTVVWKLPLTQAFGEDLKQTDPDGDGQHMHIALRFAGQVYDQETGLHYNYFRDYDPLTGRYLQSDPIGLDGGLNTYAYVGNNPLKFIDPEGLWFGVDDGLFIFGGAVLGVAGRGIADIVTGNSSTFADYVGAAVGGAAGGETLLYSGNPFLAGAVGGFTGNLATQGVNNLSGRQAGLDGTSILIDTGLGALTGFIPGRPKIKGINKGRGSDLQVFKQIRTKAKKGTINNITTSTARKMLNGAFYEYGVAIGGAAGAGGSIITGRLLDDCE